MFKESCGTREGCSVVGSTVTIQLSPRLGSLPPGGAGNGNGIYLDSSGIRLIEVSTYTDLVEFVVSPDSSNDKLLVPGVRSIESAASLFDYTFGYDGIRVWQCRMEDGSLRLYESTV